MIILFVLLPLLFIGYISSIVYLFLNNKKTGGIIAIAALPLIAALSFVALFFSSLAHEPLYYKFKAKEDLVYMGFEIKDKIIVADTEYLSSIHDEFRQSRIIVSTADKKAMIQNIKDASNYSLRNESVSDSINTSRILSRGENDTIFERKYQNEIHLHGIRTVSVYTNSDTISFTIENP